MTEQLKQWDGARVRTWLERRFAAARLDQAAADRRGYEARDDYDKAAAEEWVCHKLKIADCSHEQGAFAKYLKELLGWDEYPATSIHDNVRFDRHVRSYLRKMVKMTKMNEGFEKMFHHQ